MRRGCQSLGVRRIYGFRLVIFLLVMAGLILSGCSQQIPKQKQEETNVILQEKLAYTKKLNESVHTWIEGWKRYTDAIKYSEKNEFDQAYMALEEAKSYFKQARDKFSELKDYAQTPTQLKISNIGLDATDLSIEACNDWAKYLKYKEQGMEFSKDAIKYMGSSLDKMEKARQIVMDKIWRLSFNETLKELGVR